MTRIFVGLLLLIVALAPGRGAADTTADAILAGINALRDQAGVDRVSPSPELDAAAREHARSMLADSFFGETGPSGVSLSDRMQAAGALPPAYRALIASGSTTAQDLLASLSRDPSTRTDLVSERVSHVGVGRADGKAILESGGRLNGAWVLILADIRIRPVANARADLIAAINDLRRDRGLAPLVAAGRLGDAAQRHADTMVAEGLYAHESPTTGTVADRAVAAGYPAMQVGEVLAVNHPTADEAAAGWSRSESHAEVLFRPTSTEIGAGYHPGPLKADGRILRNVWVAVIGNPR